MKLPLALVALCAALPSQETEPLTPVGQAWAFGGDCRRIVIAPDQQHALTIGEYGDLVWWDLRARKILRYFEPLAEFVTAVAFHPDGEWIAHGIGPGDWNGQVIGADLRTGQRFAISADYASKLAFDESGDNLAVYTKTGSLTEYAFYDVRSWRVGCPKPERGLDDAAILRFASYQHRQPPRKYGQKFCTSPNGKRRARWADDAIYTPQKTTIVTASTWLTNAALTDDGTLLTSDAVGQVHLLDANAPIAPQAAERPPFAPHRGHADRLVFSRDGKHLAILGLAAIRIVDLQGNVEIAQSGTQLVEPAADGGEFWLVRPDSASRWNAATGTQIGDRESWNDVRLQTLAGDSRVEGFFIGDGPGVASVWRLNRSCIANASARGAASLQLRQWRADGWRDLQVATRWATPVDIHQVGDPERQLLHAYRSSPLGTFTDLLLLDEDGDIAHRWTKNTSLDWLAIDEQHKRIWFCTDTVRGLDATNLKEIQTFEPETNWVHAVAWQNGALLVTDGEQLQVIDPMQEKVLRRFERPADFAEIDVIAASPDGTHIAVADNCDVRILRVPK